MLDLFCEKHRIGKAVMLNARLGITNYETRKEKKTKQIYLYRKQYAKKNIHNAYIHTSSDMREVKGDDDTTPRRQPAAEPSTEIMLKFFYFDLSCGKVCAK